MIPTGTCDLRLGDNWVKCVVDSGTSCTVLRSDALDVKEYQSMLQDSQIKVNLLPAFGKAVEADLITVPCCMINKHGVQTSPVLISCAVTNELHSQSLLTVQDYCKLMQQSRGVLVSCLDSDVIMVTNST